jgi:hypothetical protein
MRPWAENFLGITELSFWGTWMYILQKLRREDGVQHLVCPFSHGMYKGDATNKEKCMVGSQSEIKQHLFNERPHGLKNAR